LIHCEELMNYNTCTLIFVLRVIVNYNDLYEFISFKLNLFLATASFNFD